jgi:hypothetical protein
MEVKILKPFSGGGYAPQIGEILNVPEKFAKDWIAHRLAEKNVKETADKKVIAETADIK